MQSTIFTTPSVDPSPLSSFRPLWLFYGYFEWILMEIENGPILQSMQ